MKSLLILILLAVLVGGCGSSICDSSSPNYDPQRCQDILGDFLQQQQMQQQQMQMQQQQMQMQRMEQDIRRFRMQQF